MDSDLNDFGKAIPKVVHHTPRTLSPYEQLKKERAQMQDDEAKTCNMYMQWAGRGPRTYQPIGPSQKRLDSGVYRIDFDQVIVFRHQNVELDDLMYFQDSVGDEIVKEVEVFWKSPEKFSRFGLAHKRGYLLYGPQGSGKTCIVGQLVQKILTEYNGIVFFCDTSPELIKQGLQIFRSIEPSRYALCIYEDIDTIIEERGEAGVLSLLDGESQIDSVLNIATTNYPEKLDPRIISRPRRFDRVVKIDMPNAEVRKAYFNGKLCGKGNGMVGATEAEIDKWVFASEGFSFAALAEMIISVHCLKRPFEETVKVLQDMSRRPTSRDYFGTTVGFNDGR
jgi:SpoVK/Ycf46/Vps4 family AAA+-type ATPase